MKKVYNRHWPFLATGPFLSLLLILFWFFNQSYLSQAKGPVIALLENPLITFGLIIFGAFVSAFISGEYSIKTPVTYEPLIFAFIGGICMGVGAVIAAMSTHSVVLFNLAGIFNLTACMITKGWVYAASMIIGGYAGAKVFSFLITRTDHLQRDFFIPQTLLRKKTQKNIFLVLLSLFIIFIAAVALFSVLSAQAKIGFLFAITLLFLFGVIVERGTICMSSMLKEWFLARRAYVWRSIMFTIMCLALLYYAGLLWGLFEPIQLEEYIQNAGLLVYGSFLMGFGFIFADGCFIGSLWKAGQGNIINMIGILGMLVGMGVLKAVMKFFTGSRTAIAGSHIPNYLNTIIHPLAFVVLLWTAGIILLIIFKQKHYRY